jgi:hypothetical protein
MRLDRRAIEAQSLKPYLYYPFALQRFEEPLKRSVLAPAAHSHVNRMPIPERFGQSSPFASVFGHVRDSVDELQIADADVASPARKTRRDALELLRSDYNGTILVVL